LEVAVGVGAREGAAVMTMMIAVGTVAAVAVALLTLLDISGYF